MKNETLEKKIRDIYNKRYKTVHKRVVSALEEGAIDKEALTLEDVKTMAHTIMEIETNSLKEDLESLLSKKEMIERELEKKSEELQNAKYEIFNALEDEFEEDETVLTKLHQVKLQSIDLYDILSEMVESAVITALEKDSDGDISESMTEVIKEMTFEAIKEGSLNTIRIRKILYTILSTTVEVAEATPTRAEEILSATLRGMRAGLVKAISRFKKRLEFMPVEAKHILIEDYDTIIEDLNQTDTLFTQVVLTQAGENSQATKDLLLKINKEMAYDLEELIHISKETAEVMKERFSSFAKTAAKKADMALRSPKAQEAKRMGIQAFGVAREALGSALKSAKDAMDKKQ